MNDTIYGIKIKDISGNEIEMSNYKNKTLLVVNVASKCGFTPQYKGLEELYQKLKDRDFEILGFPCNQFGSQEPGNESDIKEFCSLTYNVTFPMFSKVDVNGKNTHPFYEVLKNSCPGLLGSKAIKWNFTKFLIDKNGTPVKRFSPTDTPEKIGEELEKYL